MLICYPVRLYGDCFFRLLIDLFKEPFKHLLFLTSFRCYFVGYKELDAVLSNLSPGWTGRCVCRDFYEM